MPYCRDNSDSVSMLQSDPFGSLVVPYYLVHFWFDIIIPSLLYFAILSLIPAKSGARKLRMNYTHFHGFDAARCGNAESDTGAGT